LPFAYGFCVHLVADTPAHGSLLQAIALLTLKQSEDPKYPL